MVSTWFPHGFHMVSTWFPHGFHMFYNLAMIMFIVCYSWLQILKIIDISSFKTWLRHVVIPSVHVISASGIFKSAN